MNSYQRNEDNENGEIRRHGETEFNINIYKENFLAPMESEQRGSRYAETESDDFRERMK